MLTGLLGGLTSSTVATLNFARLSRQSEGADRVLAAAAAVACATMLPRILLVVGVLNWPLLLLLIAPLGGGGAGDLSGRRPAVASTGGRQVDPSACASTIPSNSGWRCGSVCC